MADAIFHQSPAESSRPRSRVSRFAFAMAAETLFLMALGSATRVMNAGLACPDWPLCYGELVPRQQMNFQVFLELFHRLTASSMGFFAIALAATAWWYRRSLPRWTPWATTFALVLVVVQGLLGALTVTELLRFDIVTAHLGTALLFFVTLLAIGVALMPHKGIGTAEKLPWVGLLAAVLVYVQSILGALVASQWALHQCLNDSGLCLVMHSHVAGVVPPTLATLALVILAWRTPALHPTLRRLASIASGLIMLQILLGVATFKLRLQVEPLTVSHQAIGAALLGALVAFTVLALRDGSPATVDESVEPFSAAVQSAATSSFPGDRANGQPA
ncbi:COX15/CtaA family protein [Stenomitos frigidus]|uniref:Heme A synthase n=1 Tax=Stenomitos frigidus ULC18 TaxID=2107698 RepID=A0A2T1E537_9CYAN|nr:heme A synthase [Stenomitos frigidus]PSB27848.1 heme A synthase [Stenomitos frigidus ULC18]